MKADSLVARLALSLSLLLTSFLPLVPAQTAAPQAEPAAVRLPGLKKGVKVRRDERGIAYVEAEDELDLYFAQGYVTAGDRLWQMDLFRRTARGELSEIFGKAALEEDKRRRNYGFAQVAEATAVT
jgi:penicillin G amidase